MGFNFHGVLSFTDVRGSGTDLCLTDWDTGDNSLSPMSQSPSETFSSELCNSVASIAFETRAVVAWILEEVDSAPCGVKSFPETPGSEIWISAILVGFSDEIGANFDSRVGFASSVVGFITSEGLGWLLLHGLDLSLV